SANDGLSPAILAEVEPFTDGLKSRHGELVYGGGAAGLMGAFANSALRAGLKVYGAITKRLNDGYEVGHKGLTELKIVDDLFDRKRYFIDESDAFFIYPGGFGTLDEALEVLTWKGLGELDKPIVFVNIDGFWDETLRSFRDLEKRGVIRPGAWELFEVVRTSEEAWAWWDRSQT
ncbi:MAG: TIGR00730 family Rossman fold protein, partial [Bdellovibrionaceae bacterium]|nr:TIGR00730 family Rossman fold protein [Pseudobdellovibrionaceae bacterium]